MSKSLHGYRMADRLEEELLEYQEVFALYDRDGDGMISKKELGSTMRLLGQNLTDAELQEMISAVDTTDKGGIDFPEFLTMMEHQTVDDDIDSKTIEAFKAFDKDGNGLISPAELHMALTSLGQDISPEEVVNIISEVDDDEDGHLNFHEFQAMMSVKKL